jgi:hypothetical protein
MVAAISETGRVYGRLTVQHRVVAPVDRIMAPTQRTSAWWQCQCECGASVPVRGVDLRSGVRKSCGCRGRVVDVVA